MIPSAFAEECLCTETLQTHFANVCYPDQETLGRFFWRISGSKFVLPDELTTAKFRVDRIAERVQSILDMRPDQFRFRIELCPHYREGNIAEYSAGTRTVRVYADKITDGVFAHEVAHAVIHAYFRTPPPAKVQEILAQYVDRHLWEDY